MVAPTAVGAETPWEGHTWGALMERAFNREGLTNSGYSGTDPTKPAAQAGEIARMNDLMLATMTALQQRFDDLFPVSEADVVAASDYSAVDVPADFGRLIQGGASVNGHPLQIIRSEEFARHIRPTSEGGGTTLSSEDGAPAFGRFALASPAGATTRRTLCLFVYPPQAAAFTVHFMYKATAKSIAATNYTYTVRMPVMLVPMFFKKLSQAWAEGTNDLAGAAKRAGFAQAESDEQENVPTHDGGTRALTQGFPAEQRPLDL